MKMSVEKEKLTWEISVGAMEDSKCVAMDKRENILPFQIIQLTQNEKMILAFRKVNFQFSRGKFSIILKLTLFWCLTSVPP